MRPIITSILIISYLGLSGQSPTFKQVKTIVTYLNQDNILDTITLSSSLSDNSSFNNISISISGFKKQYFLAKSAWTNVDSSFLTKNKNLLKTKKLFLAKNEIQSVILLFGHLYDDGREEFSIINIKNNKVEMVLDDNNNLDIEIPTKIIDIDKDGNIDFVYKHLGEIEEQVDSLDAEIGTYQPFFVYTINNNCQLNKVLTKKYNEDHYVYAGLENTDKIKVLYPRNGSKPKIIK